jgi:hypothetical protein
MNSSNAGYVEALANDELMRALTELANLRDDPEAFERFQARWPTLAHVSDDADELHPIHETSLPLKFWLIYERREKLRDIWEGKPDYLKEFLLPHDPPEELRVTGFYIDKSSTKRQVGVIWDAPIDLDWRRGQIIYEPRTEFQRAIYALFRRSALAKVCANPDCLARYFVARKATQRYCSEKCAEVFQKVYKRKWWTEHGDEWRRGRKKTRRKSGGKR